MLGNQLKSLRKQKKITQAELAQRLGITQQAVGRWETSASSPDPDTLVRIAEIFEVSVDSLLGREQTFARNVHPYIPAAECMVPVIGSVRAGYNALAFEEDYGSEPATVRDPENYFYLVVKGESMEPRISDGDLALVRRQQTLDNGDLGVVVYGEGDGTLKRFFRRGSTIILQPFNPDYETLTITGEALEDLYIAGKVVETKTRW